MAADRIYGFHPKAVFWKEKTGRSFAIIGSSNLTRAAFETNYEANVYCPLSAADYAIAKQWVKRIEAQSLPVSEDWLDVYNEAPSAGGSRGGGAKKEGPDAEPLVLFTLPKPPGMKKKIADRRDQLDAYKGQQAGLMRLFRRCANGEISSEEFYNNLPRYWSHEHNDRLQGAGFEILGKHSDFHALSQSFMKILTAADDDRDDTVVEEIDRLREEGCQHGRPSFPKCFA